MDKYTRIVITVVAVCLIAFAIKALEPTLANINNEKTGSITDFLSKRIKYANIIAEKFGLSFTVEKQDIPDVVELGYGFFLSDKEHGISLIADKNQNIHTIHLYFTRTNDYNVYNGPLPFGILVTDDMKQVEMKLLAKPTRMNEKGVETDGWIVNWARFDISDIGYHFSWDINSGKLIHISVMSPIPEHLK